MAPTFRRSQWIIPILSTLLVIFSPERSGAQPVVPAQDGTGTVVTPDGNQFDVTGGQLSADNANLFHNFERLGLSEGQVLNFISSPEIVNILGRVTGGEASFIDGLVQITGGNSNLFLINPAGILFGQNASLNIPGSLTLTTATGIGFESDVGIQFLQGDNWSELVGTPNRFVFDADNPGSIANFGDLSVSPGAEITVLAGSVLNAGKLDAPEGRVTIAALPDAEMIRISQEGNLLNLEVLPAPGIDLQQTGLSPLSLPELLTGAGDIVPATKVEVTGTGEITLVGSDATVSEQQGTATMTEDVNTDSLEVHGQNILLDESLALSPNTRLILQAPEGEVTLSQLGEPDAELSEILVTAETATLSGDLFSDEAIDLSEVNQLDLVGESITLDTSSGDGPINLASNTNGAGDLTLDSGLGRATFGTIGDVESPNSLRVSGNEASGNGAIIAGSGGITIDSTEEVNLEASLSTEGTVALSSTEGNVLTNDITATDIDLSAQQDLNTGNLFTSSDTAAGGAITLEAVEGEIITGQIDSFGVDGGAITLQANTRIQTREIDSSGTPGNAGNVTLEALGDIEASLIRAEGGAEGQGGNVFIDSSEGLVRVTSAFPTSFSETGLASISTGGELGGGSIIIRHAGEQLGETFAVGETTLNGTSDAITSGDSEIPLPSTFSESITEGNITIEASNPGVSSPPDNPEEPDNPGFPEIPELPEEPEEPDNPDDPEPPEFPEEPDEFENPDDPEPPEFLEEPDEFENPDEFRNPEFPEEPDEFENPDEFEPPEFAGEFDEFPDGFEPPGFPRDPSEFPDGFEPPDVGEFGGPIDLIESVGLDTSEPPAPVALARIRTRIESSDSEGSIAVGEGPLQLTNRGGLAERVDSSAPVESVNRAVPDKSAESKSPVDSSNAEGPVDAGDESTAEVGETLVPQGLITANDQRAFQTTNVDATLSLLEEGRNAEFSDYLGLKQTGVRDRQTLQSGLEKIEAETQEVYVVVYVAVQDDKLELVLMSSSGEPIRRSVVEATPEKLSSTIHNLYLKITNPREHTTKGYREPAQQLYQWMIQPIESDLQQMGATTLLFSLGKGLRSIPIATLWDGQQHLIEKYNYSIIPTTSLVDMKYSSLKETDVLAMGASEFQDKAALPAVPTELSTITTLWPGQSFLNESFTLDNLRNQRQQKNYEVIHLATHADFQPGTSNDSYIQLWDGRLPISQLPGLNWDTPPVELLVLSACRTAVGDQNAELGFAGLAIQAGVKSAIASLWHVNDESTLALMSQFYNDLHKSSIKAGALRKAQLAMLQGKVRLESGQLHTEYGTVPLPPEFEGVTSADFSHPYYWSGFAMIGAPW